MTAGTFTFLGRTFNVYEILRLVTIVGAYLLFRPYLLKLTQKFQERDHSRPIQAGEESSPAAVGDANTKSALGGDGEEEESDGEDMSWGAKARRRKRAERKEAKKLIEEEERRIAEEASDEEIEEFLEK